MTESLKPLRVTCHFCHEVVLDIVCDKVVIKKALNKSKYVKKIEVYRCSDCRERERGK